MACRPARATRRRAAARRGAQASMCFFTRAHADSIGLQSCEEGGKNFTAAPRRSIARRTAGRLCAARLSRTTIARGHKRRISACRTGARPETDDPSDTVGGRSAPLGSRPPVCGPPVAARFARARAPSGRGGPTPVKRPMGAAGAVDAQTRPTVPCKTRGRVSHGDHRPATRMQTYNGWEHFYLGLTPVECCAR